MHLGQATSRTVSDRVHAIANRFTTLKHLQAATCEAGTRNLTKEHATIAVGTRCEEAVRLAPIVVLVVAQPKLKRSVATPSVVVKHHAPANSSTITAQRATGRMRRPLLVIKAVALCTHRRACAVATRGCAHLLNRHPCISIDHTPRLVITHGLQCYVAHRIGGRELPDGVRVVALDHEATGLHEAWDAPTANGVGRRAAREGLPEWVGSTGVGAGSDPVETRPPSSLCRHIAKNRERFSVCVSDRIQTIASRLAAFQYFPAAL